MNVGGALTVRIFESEVHTIVAEILRHPHIETGGGLFGLWSHGGAPTVMLATRPGPQAVQQRHHFQQDPATHSEVERMVWERFGLQCVGLWHSHHHLPLQELSHGDILRASGYARRHKRQRLSEILGFYLDDERPDAAAHVGLLPTVYTHAPSARTAAAGFRPLPGMSPVRAALRGPVEPGIGDALRAGRPPGSPWTLLSSKPAVLESAPPEDMS